MITLTPTPAITRAIELIETTERKKTWPGWYLPVVEAFRDTIGEVQLKVRLRDNEGKHLRKAVMAAMRTHPAFTLLREPQAFYDCALYFERVTRFWEAQSQDFKEKKHHPKVVWQAMASVEGNPRPQRKAQNQEDNPEPNHEAVVQELLNLRKRNAQLEANLRNKGFEESQKASREGRMSALRDPGPIDLARAIRAQRHDRLAVMREMLVEEAGDDVRRLALVSRFDKVFGIQEGETQGDEAAASLLQTSPVLPGDGPDQLASGKLVTVDSADHEEVAGQPEPTAARMSAEPALSDEVATIENPYIEPKSWVTIRTKGVRQTLKPPGLQVEVLNAEYAFVAVWLDGKQSRADFRKTKRAADRKARQLVDAGFPVMVVPCNHEVDWEPMMPAGVSPGEKRDHDGKGRVSD